MLKEKQLKEGSKEMLLNENNICKLEGKLAGRFEFSHQKNSENFYSNVIKVERLSGNVDEIPIVVSERRKEIDFSKDYTGVNFILSGTVETYNYIKMGKSHLKVYVLVISCALQKGDIQEDNYVYLEGYICKKPVFRITPQGKKITDVIIAVNSFKKSAYIPCIAWNNNALELSKYNIGDSLKIKGRIQSREYLKMYSDNLEQAEKKTAYEVSIYDLKKLG